MHSRGLKLVEIAQKLLEAESLKPEVSSLFTVL